MICLYNNDFSGNLSENSGDRALIAPSGKKGGDALCFLRTSLDSSLSDPPLVPERTNADTRSGFLIENTDAVRPPMEWATIAVLSIPIWSSSPSKSSAKAALPLGSGSSGVLPKVR